MFILYLRFNSNLILDAKDGEEEPYTSQEF